ncbi:MAG TPA: carboxynorspermidine decarboxylase [Spirochaetota bacterium]|nr:carboxynorspermidine decarboxylase [Spirochaetota bacterium]HPR50023.1 carboxynorspermidine decarboxylase [Spirochaetota bacterium]
MAGNVFINLDTSKVKTPCFIVDADSVEQNLLVLNEIQHRTGCRILLALKAFSMFSLFPLIKKYLNGTCASSPHEARLGREEFGGEVHSFAAAFSESDFSELMKYSDHIVFNSLSQYRKFRGDVIRSRSVKFGLRINPEVSQAPVPMYDPCGRYSRLGITAAEFAPSCLEGISGLHFHALCEENSPALEKTLNAFEANFGRYLDDLEWLNLGGGHHITRSDYDRELLCSLVERVKNKYDLTVYLEPGEAVALNTGIMVTTVLDVIRNEIDIAVLDTSAAAHLPDVLEMPYRPSIIGADQPGVLSHTYRLGGISCLAGDVIGDYSFDHPLKPGEKIVLLDMAHYTMVKTNTFNGIALPSIAICRTSTGEITTVREFGYHDFKTRLS